MKDHELTIRGKSFSDGLRGLSLVALLLGVVVVRPVAAATPPPGTSIDNQASAAYFSVTFGQNLTVTSAVVSATVQALLPPPTISYYTDNTYARLATATGLGAPLYIQATAAGCNADPLVAETHPITVRSTLTGDTETLTAVETGPNTGLFRITLPTADARTQSAAPGDGTLETLPNDTVTAEMQGCGAASVTTIILIDPFGVVFDSRNNAPIAGATVVLIDVTGAGNGGHPGGPATVFQFDGVTAASATNATGPTGLFQFPNVLPSTYRLQIIPPANYKFPSVVAVRNLPAGRSIDHAGSYGHNFGVTATTGTLRFDVPLDASISGAPLFIEKTVSAPEAEIGDVVTYSIKIGNAGTTTMTGAVLDDQLPAGFGYLRGSAKLDAHKLTDPVGGEGPRLQFAIGNLNAGQSVTLTYRLRVGVGAINGTGINRARVSADGTPRLLSNRAQAVVKIREGVFTGKSIIFGKVFVDSNHNDIQDDTEPGIPGVRLYLEDGTFVVTDGEGKYSIYGLTARTHALKVDETTLPVGFKGARLTTRHNARGTLAMVDLQRHELRKVNFADVSDDPRVRAEVVVRRKKCGAQTAEIERTLKTALTADGQPLPISDVRALSAAGLVGETNGVPTQFTSVLPANSLTGGNSNKPDAPVSTVPRVDLEALVAQLNNELDFVDLHDDDTLPVAQANVRIKGRQGSRFMLWVNGVVMPPSRVGKKVVLAPKQIEAWEFVGVDLRPGANTLEIAQLDGFGNARGAKQINVIAPGKLGHVRLTLPKQDQPADGVTPAMIRVEIVDDHGVRVTARTAVTLESSLGRWDTKDLNEKEPGTQVLIEGGTAEFALLPPTEPGTARLVVSCGVLKDEAQLGFLPALRPMIAAGVLETRVALRKFNLSALRPARRDDGFEEELRNWAYSGDHGKLQGNGSAALYLKGKIKGDYLLTLAYDSEKEPNERLFRDIQPDEFYPVYGDSSVRGYDAQSTGRLYVRVDKRHCYVLYGDFTTQSGDEAHGLGNYNRSLTGPKLHLENSRVSANAWSTYDSTRQVIQEFPGDGTSGPYFFSIRNALENSEKVEIIVRDRNQPSVILSVTALARFADYEFEPFSGRLLLKAPVPSLDSNLNPISIRVTFEVDQGGKRFLTAGVDGQLKITPFWEVGGSAVRDQNPIDHYQLYSFNTVLRLAKNTVVLAEVAQTQDEILGTGHGGRVELRHTGNTDVRIYAAHVETNFDNTASVITPGRDEAGFKVTQKLTLQDQLVAEGRFSRDLATHGELFAAQGSIDHTFANKMTLGVGLLHSDETPAPATSTGAGVTPLHVDALMLRASSPVPFVPRATVDAQYENDLNNTALRSFNVGAKYQLNDRTRAYAREEFLDSLGSPFELNTAQQNSRTVFGFETEYLKDAHLFNEYRMNDALSGREGETAIGLRNTWDVFNGVKLNTSFERVNPLFGSNTTAEATAATLGWEYLRDSLWKTTGRVEFRTSQTADHWLNTLGFARKLDDQWTALARSILDYQTSKAGQGDQFQSRLQLGMAYRPLHTDVWNALGKYEYRYEDNTAGTPSVSNPTATTSTAAAVRQVHIFTLQANYQPCAKLTLSGQYAFKIVDESGDTYDAHLLAARTMYDVTKRWTAGLSASALFSSVDGSVDYGVGPEVGFRFADSAWVSIGYNLFGFHDRDLSEGNYTDHGFYLAVRMSFDEHLFDALKRGKP